ncbi:MAG TPA: alkaline phosphatase family protein [Planctomycetaceae bacterium]|nr:alkaline phosphatase family protein [Planctomycetaceae bacterium]
MTARREFFSFLWVVSGFLLAGCERDVTIRAQLEAVPTASATTIAIPGNTEWVDTGFEFQAGESFSITAFGSIKPGKKSTLSSEGSVGPEGTYFYDDRALDEVFPLPATRLGPAPCYGLIGRIGHGSPFFVGQKVSLTAEDSGRLYLGINDFNFRDNTGRFEARVEALSNPQPLRFENQFSGAQTKVSAPVKDARVVVFYLDGLRPDVIREMAAMEHIPTIKKLFIDGGTWLGDTFTGFPSDTITSNGTMWTGCFSDRHGLKGQVRFSRRSLYSESYLETLGPNRSTRLLNPEGVDKLVQSAQAAAYDVAHGERAGERWRMSQVSDIPPLFRHLRDNNSDWATGILPMMTEVPPMLWTRSLIRTMPYFRAQEAWNYIDDANTHFALKYLIAQDRPVTIIWLPETDSISHKKSRGQFGVTRRTIALADRLIEKVVRSLEAQGLRDSTYFMLVSDHGHHGGRESHLTHYDLADELFHRPREVDEQGRWVGGGLGMSVRQHRFWNRHPEDSSREFVFVDGDSDGAARIFLPKDHYRSNEWYGTSSPAKLLQYRIDKKIPPLNLPETIAAARGRDGQGRWQNPIDLVLMRLSETSILITTSDRGQAVIDRRLRLDSKWVYRYRVVKNVRPTSDGGAAFDVVSHPKRDPLELLLFLPQDFSNLHMDEREWLRLTSDSKYPDSVVALTRHMLWQSNLKYREDEFAPDLVVTARPNWYFSQHSSPGTMHGYPLEDSMRATWFVSGPHIRRGARLREPVRLADLTPTILHLVGMDNEDFEFDGRVVREILEPEVAYFPQAEATPLYWKDLDLRAWQAIPYEPAAPYEHLPWTIDRPDSPLDFNNIAYNLISIGDISVWRIFDDVLAPLTDDKEIVIGTIEEIEQKTWKINEASGEAVMAIDLSGMSLGDYSQTSIGNLKRIDRAVDWVQKRSQNLDRKVADRIGAEQTPPAQVVHGTIDVAQRVVWEGYRFAQRVAVQILDEKLLNGVEDSVDRTVNRFRVVPAEQPVP